MMFCNLTNIPFPLKQYQINRLTSFINPEKDPTGSGWNIRQAIIAVGSGQFLGKGLFRGTQGRLGYLPESHTDFIFSVLCEELGFVGAFGVLVLYYYFICLGIKVIQNARDKLGGLIAAGVVAIFLFHILENIGMNIGIMPITGIPLPFISYGGSSIFSNCLAIGLLQNIWLRRRKISF